MHPAVATETRKLSALSNFDLLASRRRNLDLGEELTPSELEVRRTASSLRRCAALVL
jgi:hypothetical protein